MTEELDEVELPNSPFDDQVAATNTALDGLDASAEALRAGRAALEAAAGLLIARGDLDGGIAAREAAVAAVKAEGAALDALVSSAGQSAAATEAHREAIRAEIEALIDGLSEA